MNRNNAEGIVINEGKLLTLEIDQIKIEVLLRIDENLPDGIIGLSVNLPGMEFIELPGFGKLSQ